MDEKILRVPLSKQEDADLVAFLNALTGDSPWNEPVEEENDE